VNQEQPARQVQSSEERDAKDDVEFFHERDNNKNVVLFNCKRRERIEGKDLRRYQTNHSISVLGPFLQNRRRDLHSQDN
jgi:hypothetical protein